MGLWLALALCLTLTLCLFIGCDRNHPADGTDEPTAAPTDAPTEEPTAAPTEEPPGTPTEEPTEEVTEEPEPEKTSYSILFIGNSYTYYNDMPTAIFQAMARAEGYDVSVTAITMGSYYLSQFADPSDTYGAKVEAALTGSKKYDFVVLQEQSLRPAGSNVSEFYSAVRNLSERIRKTGATPILYATWGRQTGSSTLTKYGWTNESMTWKLAAAYQAIGEELDIPVVHVGLAFYDVYTYQKDIDLYNTDKSHPSYSGSYLAAVALYAKMLNVDPTEISYKGNLSGYEARLLREAARKAVFETPAIPEKYQTSSR